MGIEEDSGTGINVSGIVYERRLITSKKWMAGTNAGGIFLSDPIDIPMGIRESFENSRIGQAINKAKQGKQSVQYPR